MDLFLFRKKLGKKAEMVSQEKNVLREIKISNKRAEMVSQELVTWIMYALIAVGAIFAIRAIFIKFG